MWLLRLALAFGRTPAELAEVLTAADLADFQALVEVDGPFWAEGLAAHLRQLCAVTTAAAGVSTSPDRFAIEWTLGAQREEQPLITGAEGIEILAASAGVTVQRIPADGRNHDR